jgi:hypothetical protein
LLVDGVKGGEKHTHTRGHNLIKYSFFLLNKKKKMLPVILMVTWYGLRGALLYGANAMQARGWIIKNYSHFEKRLEPDAFGQLVKHERPHLVLFWCYDGLTQAHVHCAREALPSIKVGLYTWDDPFALRTNAVYRQLALACDAIWTCSREAQAHYRDHGVPNVAYLLPGFHDQGPPKSTLLIYETEQQPDGFACDVSFVVGNLYSDAHQYPDQRFLRKEVVLALIAGARAKHYTLHLYGAPVLQELGAEFYKGHLEDAHTEQVFRTSRLNVCTHVCVSAAYLNERAVRILGAGGLLWVDAAENVSELPQDTYVLFPQTLACIADQANALLQEPDRLAAIRQRGYQFALRHLEFAAWAQTLDEVFTRI